MLILFDNSDVFLSGFHCRLGGRERGVEELAGAKLLFTPAAELAKIGYERNHMLAPGESLTSLSAHTLSAALAQCPKPDALVFHSNYADSAVPASAPGETDPIARAHYFAGDLMRELRLDHIPYFGSFATGCVGFMSLALMAAELVQHSSQGAVVCHTADVSPAGATADTHREKFLLSDVSASFAAGRKPGGYRLLGMRFYSSTRPLVPVVEIVKRCVDLAADLARALGRDVKSNDTLIHYPNVFPQAWEMVTRYLKMAPAQHVLEGMRERAHCGTSDSFFTLTRHHEGRAGRLHLVVNYGAGVHLGVCALEEQSAALPA